MLLYRYHQIFLLEFVLICILFAIGPNIFAMYSGEKMNTTWYGVEAEERRVPVQNLIKEADHLINKGEYVPAIEIYLKVVDAAKNGYYSEYIDVLNKIAFAYKAIQDFKNALDYYNKLLEFFPDKLSQHEYAKTLNHIGDLYFRIGNLEKAQSYQTNSLTNFEEVKDSAGIRESIYELGLIAYDLQHFNEALILYKKALAIEVGNTRFAPILKFTTLCAIGSTYEKLHQYEKALYYNTQSLKLAKEIGYTFGVAFAHQSIGTTYLNTTKYDSASVNLFKAEAIFDTLGYAEGRATTLNYIGSLYEEMQLYRKAIQHFEKALFIANEIKHKQTQVNALKGLSQSHKYLGEFELAHHYLESSNTIRDSIINEESYKKMASMKAAYEIEAKNREIKIQEQLIKKEQQYKWYILIIAGFALLLSVLFLVYVYRNYRQTASHANTLEEKNTKIASQNARLEEVNEELKEKSDRIEHQNEVLAKINLELEEKSDQISSQNRKLEFVNQELQQYAYVASHDLKEPLRTIGSFSSILKTQYSHLLDERGIEYFNYITEGTKRMKQMLEDLLYYSQIDKIGEDLQVIESSDVIREVISSLDGTIKQSNGRVAVNFSAFPKLKVAKTHLSQLFQNLIANGLKFAKDHEPPVISVDCKRRDDHYVFSIKDNGMGMPPEAKERIFNMFTRLHKDKREGTGIGLATCKKIADLYHGKITVESEVNKGSTFFIHIPKNHQMI